MVKSIIKGLKSEKLIRNHSLLFDPQIKIYPKQQNNSPRDHYLTFCFVKLVQVVPQVQRHSAILVVCWACCWLLGKRCNLWLTLHWWANQLYWRSRECSAISLYPRFWMQCRRRRDKKKGLKQRRRQSKTDLTKCVQILIQGSACTLHDLSQETHRYTTNTPQTTGWHSQCQHHTNHSRCFAWLNFLLHIWYKFSI